MKNKILLILLLTLLSQNTYSADNQISPAEENQTKYEQRSPKRRLSIKSMSLGVQKAIDSIKKDPFSEESVWDQAFLKRDTEIVNILKKFIAGEYAQKAKNLKLDNMSKDAIIKKLLSEGFEKKEPEGRMDGLFGRSKDREFQDSGDIYVNADGSMIRVKDYSLTRKYRPQAYTIKAVLKNPTGPVTWQNEAFKVTKDGYPVPKSPRQNHGMKIHAPNSTNPDEDKGWIDLIMEEVHVDIKK